MRATWLYPAAVFCLGSCAPRTPEARDEHLLVDTLAQVRAEYLRPQDDHYVSFFENTVVRLLPGYRLPERADFASYWGHIGSYIYGTTDDTDNRKAPWWTKGRFNDDTIVDYAFILIADADSAKTLFAVLSGPDGYHAVVLDDRVDSEPGLATQRPGTIHVIPEGKREREPLPLERAAIAYFHFEAWSLVYVWDANRDEFRRYWVSE